MLKAKIVLGIAFLVLLVVGGWQTAAVCIANAELQEDLHDLAAQVGTHIGLDAPTTPEELRRLVVQKAEKYDIELQPEQVVLGVKGYGPNQLVTLSADYEAQVRIFFFSYQVHFTPSSTK